MTKKDILQKAIKKTMDNGWDDTIIGCEIMTGDATSIESGNDWWSANNLDMSTGIYQRTAEHNRRNSESKKGKPNYWMPTGEKSALWRGSQASYSPLHKRLYKLKGKASECNEVGCTKMSTRFEWANLTGNYADIEVYRSMCKSCHAKFDNAKFNLPHLHHD